MEPSFEFGHARPSDSLAIRYVRDGRTDGPTDGRTDKSKVYCPLPYGQGHNKYDADCNVQLLLEAGQ